MEEEREPTTPLELHDELVRLRRFKQRVHSILDDYGVPACEDVPCRVQARLEYVLLSAGLHPKSGKFSTGESY